MTQPPPDHHDPPAGEPERFALDAESRLRVIDEADRPGGNAIQLGASNPPFDCEIFSPDYRSRLPVDDPIRKANQPRVYGSEASLKTMAAAHSACLSVLGISQPQ